MTALTPAHVEAALTNLTRRYGEAYLCRCEAPVEDMHFIVVNEPHPPVLVCARCMAEELNTATGEQAMTDQPTCAICKLPIQDHPRLQPDGAITHDSAWDCIKFMRREIDRLIDKIVELQAGQPQERHR